MKNIRIFENFQDVIYPDYYEWLHKLLPEEITFLIVYSSLIEYRSKSKYYQGPKPPAIEITEDWTTKNIDPSDPTSDSSEDDYNFTIEIICDEFFVEGECSFEGRFSNYRPATRMQPEEGGDFYLETIDVTGIQLSNTEIGAEWKINYKEPLNTDCFTNKELRGLFEEYCAVRIDASDERKTSYVVNLPEKLKEKIDLLRNPDTAKGLGLLGRYL